VSFGARLRQAKALLEEQRRVSLRALSREVELEGDALEEVIDELVEVQGVARREGKVLVWRGPADGGGAPQPTATPPTHALPPARLAEKIRRAQPALEGARKQVTVLFADVKGSMAVAEQMDPETWGAIMQRFFGILADGVERFDGFVDKFTGDGIMALFGAPIAHEDHAQRACLAALHLRDALHQYARDLRRKHGVDLGARIGLNTGEVVVGRIGDDLRMDYTAQGHTVGLAQRMEQLAEPGLPYVSESVVRLADGYFRFKDLGEFTVKGATQPLRAFGLEGPGVLRTRLELSRSRGFSRFVGRSDELATLDAALGRALEGRGGVVGVVADAGVGKSRLCLEFVQRCRTQGIAVYEAHCPSYGASVPLLPVLELMRSFFGVGVSDTDQQVREKIVGRMLLLDRALEPLLPLTFEFMGVAESAATEPAGPGTRERRLIELVQRLIQARSGRAPAVMLIDDVHWIDEASDGFVAALVETITATRTLVLLNFRPEYGAPWMSRSTYQQLPLQPLGERAVEELLSELLSDDPSLADLKALVCERTGGNPFYVEEMVRVLVEEGSLVGERGARLLAQPIERLSVPPTVQAILAARIDRLDPRERRLLQRASAIGRTFTRDLLAEIAELDEADVDAALRLLVEAELIHQHRLHPVVEYAFVHPLTHEVTEGTQLVRDRRRVHAAIAAALERTHAGKDEHAALLARHWTEAGDATQAALAHRRAAEWIAGSNVVEATRHWEQVRALAEDIADVDLADELGERSRLLILELGWRRGLSEAEVDALLREGEAWAERRQNPRALARLYNAYGTAIMLSLGWLDRARAVLEKGLAIAEDAADGPLQFALQIRLGLAASYAGDVNAALAWLAAGDASSIEDQIAASPLVGYDARAFHAGYQGWLLGLQGRVAESRKKIAEGLTHARTSGSLEVIGWVLMLESIVDFECGDAASALAHARESTAIADRIDSPLSASMALRALARVLAWTGDLDEAERLAQRSVDRTRGVLRPNLPEALCGLAEIQRLRGDLAGARRHLGEALQVSTDGGFALGRLSAEVALAELCLASGDDAGVAEAEGHLDHAAALTERTGNRLRLPVVFELRAEVARRRGDASAVERALREAHRLWTECGVPLQMDRIARLMGTAASA